MTDIVRFVRQLSHDLRNNLNAAELQSAFINEIAADAELKGEIKRLRGIFAAMGGNLQRLTTSLTEVKLTVMPYEASAFVEDLQQKLKTQFSEQASTIEWKIEPGNALLKIDPQFLQQAFLEIFENAFQHNRGSEPLRVNAEVRENDFVFTLSEPKSSVEGATENWGRTPFRKLAHGHYGLGLFRARNIIEAHGGRFDVRYDSAVLLTTIVLPLDLAQ